jgi:hypothetical protein
MLENTLNAFVGGSPMEQTGIIDDLLSAGVSIVDLMSEDNSESAPSLRKNSDLEIEVENLIKECNK